MGWHNLFRSGRAIAKRSGHVSDFVHFSLKVTPTSCHNHNNLQHQQINQAFVKHQTNDSTYILTAKGFRQRTARAYPFYFSAKISQEYPLPARRASTYSLSDRSEIRGKNFRKFLKAREKVWVTVVKTKIAGCFLRREAPGEAESTTTGLGQKLLP